MRSIRAKVTYANVIATVALFGVVAGGGAYAAATIGAGDIKKNAVRAKHVKKGAIAAAKIRNGAVRPNKLQRPPIWARVAANGTILGQSGGISMISTLGGVHQLDLGRNVDSGALIVTSIDSDGVVDGAAGGAICSHTNQCSGAADGSPSAARIYTSNTSGNVTALPFYVAVVR